MSSQTTEIKEEIVEHDYDSPYSEFIFQRKECIIESPNPEYILSEEIIPDHKINNSPIDNNSALQLIMPCLQNIVEKLNNMDQEMQNKLNRLQKEMHDKLNKLEKDVQDIKYILNSANRSNELTTNKLMEENILYAKKTAHMLKKLIREDTSEIDLELKTIFPLKTLPDLEYLETRLEDPNFAQSLATSFIRFDSIDRAYKFIADDAFYIKFNYSGTAGKHALNKFKIFNKILFDACGLSMGILKFEAEIRKCVLKSHNRFYKMKKGLQLKLK